MITINRFDMAVLISAFPGTGKSYFYEKNKDKGVLDSDSSKFDKSYFPENYIKHIKEKRETAKVILISSHKLVRDALVSEGLTFNLVYPDRSLKEEYIKRYMERGSPQGFIDLVKSNWDSWIDELENQSGCKKFVLQSGQYITDLI